MNENEYLESVIKSTPDVVVTIDVTGTVRSVNPAVERVFGYEPSELEGNPLTTLMGDGMAALHSEAFTRYLGTGERTVNWNHLELTGQHRDGHEIPLSVSFTEFTDGGDRYFTGIVRDRRERERTRRTKEAILDQIGDGVYVLDDNGRFLEVNDAYAGIVGVPREELLGAKASDVIGDIVDDAEAFQSALEAADGGTATMEWTIDRPERPPLPVEARISLFHLGGDRYGRIGVVRDISEQIDREQRFAALNEMAQSLTDATTVEEVCDTTLDAAVGILDRTETAIYSFDRDDGDFVPITGSEGTDPLVENGGLRHPYREIAWEVYSESDGRILTDLAGETDGPTSALPFESAIVLPMGSFGVLVTGARTPGEFDDTYLHLARVLVANAGAALSRVDREDAMRGKTAELERKTERLERVERLNAVIRDTTSELTAADSRTEILQSACTALAGLDGIRFVWIGDRSSVDGAIVPAASAGVERGYLDDVTDGGVVEQGPSATAFADHELVVENDLNDEPPFERWRLDALQREYRSVVSVPLVYEDSIYGVMTLYGEDDGAFGDMEVCVLNDLGEMIGYAINASERRKAAISDAAVELEFEMGDESVDALGFTSETDATFEFDALVEQSDGTLAAYYTISGVDPEAIENYDYGVTSIESVSLIAREDDELFFRAVLTGTGLPGKLLSHGAYPTELEASGERARLVVELPQGGDVQSFLDMFLTTYDDTELVARRELDRPIHTGAGFERMYRNRLTERQEEVLRTAYFAGFFERPRRSSGSDVAEMLGVSQPTVNRHVREGERKLFELLFEDLE